MWIIGAVQFVVAVDFMMILPLAPDLTVPLGIGSSDLGMVVAAYTAAASIAGVAGALFLDRVQRRVALSVGLLGLALATLAASQAVNLESMMLARGAAGLFGGPTAALALSAVADAVPAAQRGSAIGKVMGANALGAILGVPVGLWVADVWRWEGPFWAVGAVALAVTALVALGLPRVDGAHLTEDEPLKARASLQPLLAMLRRRETLTAYLMVFGVMTASFLLTPNLSAYIQYNLGFPRDEIPLLYFVAGAVSFITMRLVGWLVDRGGALRVGVGAAAGFIATIVIYLLLPEPVLPISVGFVLLLVSLSSRNVAVRTITTQVPEAHERASFLSLQSSVRYLAAAVGAVASSALLRTDDSGALSAMTLLGWLVIVASIAVLPLLASVEAFVERRDQSRV